MNNVNVFHTMYRRISNDGWNEGSDGSVKFVNRLYYVNSGKAVIEYEKVTHTLTEGNIYIMPQSDCFRRISAENFDHTYFVYTSTYTLRTDSFIELPGTFCGLDKLFAFANSVIETKNNTQTTSVALLNAVLDIIERNFDLPYVKDTKVVEALKIIRENLDTVTVKEIAKKLYLTEGYLIHFFSKTIGISPMKYIRLMRLSEGVSLLKNGMSVSEVSKKCGYSNPTAFWKSVKREYGYPPSELKKKL